MVLASPFDEYASAWSPDGRWLAYQSNESGRFEVYVRDMSAAAGRWQVSTSGGEEPQWSRDGRELYYRNDTTLMAVSLGAGATFEPSAPVALFGGLYNLRSESGISYAVDPTSGRFLMVRLASGDAAPNEVRVVLHWFDELRRLMGQK